MNNEIKLLLDTAKEAMDASIKHLNKQLQNIRAGKANPSMLTGVMVEYYGTQTPLAQVGNINTPDARTLSIQPWEKGLIPEIEKGILKANLGFTPSNNGEQVIISLPPLTEERRLDLVKVARSEAEDARVSIRNDRKNAHDDLKKLELHEDLHKNVEVDIQELTDQYIQRVDEALKLKEEEIMTV